MLRAERRPRDEHGAAAVLAAAIALAMFATAALTVDLGNTWSRRGQLQDQADKAVMYAAEFLPASDADGRTVVARAIAQYLACHPVPGQDDLDTDGIPDRTDARCGAGSDALVTGGADTELNAYAGELVDGVPGPYGAALTFPSSTTVALTGPAARVDFGFGAVLGTDGRDEQQSASAKVSSPGDLLPIGVSLTCLAQSVSNAGLGAGTSGVLPLGYVTSGHPTGAAATSPEGEPAFESWTSTYAGANASSGLVVAVPDGQPVGSMLTLDVTHLSVFAGTQVDVAADLNASIVFKRGGVETPPHGAVVGVGQLTFDLSVAALTPGTWHVKVRTFPTTTAVARRWSEVDVQITVDPDPGGIVDNVASVLVGLTDLDNTVACARLTDSPRVADAKSPSLSFNIQEGGDHALAANPGVASVLAGMSLSGSLNGSAGALLGQLGNLSANPSAGVLGCGADDVPDTQASHAAGRVANCGHVVGGSQEVEDQFTDGFLKDTPASSATSPGYGRLSCSRPGACSGPTVSLNDLGFTGEYNDDSFADFLPPTTTALDSQLAYGLDTYLLPQLPLITPSRSIDVDIYGSPRFFWAPVVTTIAALPENAGDYPILTFRPMFLDNGSSDSLPIIGVDTSDAVDDLPGFITDTVDSVCADIYGSLPAYRTVCDTVIGGPLAAALGTLDAAGLADAQVVLQAVNDVLAAIDPDLRAGEEVAGLVVHGEKLKAARFMTVTPGALPPVPATYDGPVTDYLGVGPKIIRLVE